MLQFHINNRKESMSYTDSHGRVWKPFSVRFETSDGAFLFAIMALSHLHAEEIVADIRQSALVVGEILNH